MKTNGTQTITIGIDASRAAVERQTGTERYSRRIIQELLDLGLDQRFRLYLNQRGPIPLRQRATTEQRPIPWPRLWTHVRLSAELALHPVNALFIPAHVVPPIHPRATVVTIHDLGYLHEPGSHTNRARAYLDWSTRWSVRAASSVIAISETTRADLINHYRVSERKVTVIYHGIDERFTPANDERKSGMRKALDIYGPYILFVGTIQPRKNLVRLVQAFDEIAKENPTIHLVMAGKMGWMTSEIENAVGQSSFTERIHLPGHVDDEDLPALYSAADVITLPSLYEGFGLPALEAMACGVPVVVSNRGSLPEVTGDASILVEPTEVSSLIQGLREGLNPATRQQRIDHGLRHVAQFTWQRSGKQTLETILASYSKSSR